MSKNEMSEISNSSEIKSINGYQIVERIGVGSYGRVYKVTKNKKLYVLKEIPLNLSSAAEKINSVENEADILSSLNNKYVVKFYTSFKKNQNIYIIMEYCDNGDLCTFLNRMKKERKSEDYYLDEKIIWKLFIQMSIGLYYIHSKKIIHRDIKTLNIFLTKNNDAKIGDLGVAKVLENTNHAMTFIGTPYYVSPEMCRNKPYNEKSDIWALGCILYELLTFNHPFTATNQAALFIKILNNKYNPFPSYVDEDLKNMVDFILEKDYEIRPSMKEIITTDSFQYHAKKLGLYKDLIEVLNEDFKINKEINESLIINNNYNQNIERLKENSIIINNTDYNRCNTKSNKKESSHTFIIHLTNSKNSKEGNIKNSKSNLINNNSLKNIIRKYLVGKTKKFEKKKDNKFYFSQNSHSQKKLIKYMNNSQNKRTKSDFNCLEQNNGNKNNNLAKINILESNKVKKNIFNKSNPKFIAHTKSNLSPRRTRFIFNNSGRLNDKSEKNSMNYKNNIQKKIHIKYNISGYNINMKKENSKNKNNIKYCETSRNKLIKNSKSKQNKNNPLYNKNIIFKTDLQPGKTEKIYKNKIFKIAKNQKNDLISETEFISELQNTIKNSTNRITLNDLLNHNFNLEDSKNLNTTSSTILLGKIETPSIGSEEKFDLLMKNVEEEIEKENLDELNNLCDEFTKTEMIKRSELNNQIPFSNYEIKINEDRNEINKFKEMSKDQLMKSNLIYKNQYEKYLQEIKKYQNYINLEKIKQLYNSKQDIKIIINYVKNSLKRKLPEENINTIINILYNLINYEIKFKYSQKAFENC